MKILIKIILLISLVLSTSCGAKDTDGLPKSVSENKIQPKRPANAVKVPNFTLATTQGDIVKMSDLTGKVVLINFWGTWCGPCRREIPDFIKLYDKYHDQGLEIVGITLTSGSPGQIQRFMDQWKMNYTILTDINGNETQQVTTDFGKAVGKPIVAIPTTFLVDRNGFIVKSYEGPRSEESLYYDLKPYL